ncbi:hypothetical protein ACFQMJ_02435 [Cohnella cellulosilytica]|uniref:Uncharacterized protein n=1 Tax=Cohnella cellulosilytica TaxID=986710 RepID=A0ABW2F2K4_9BACL
METLRAVEVHCYSLCIHILVEEALAWNACRLTLIDLFQDKRFGSLDESEQNRLVRMKAIARSMELAASRTEMNKGEKRGIGSVTLGR